MTPKEYGEEGSTHNCSEGVSSTASSTIPDAVHADSVSSSETSCISEVAEAEGSVDNQQLLYLLDALENLLSLREYLMKRLAKGWMEIASARYSMGPSRINQALFSLKPCSASTVISVSTAKDFSEAKSPVGTNEEESDSNCAFHLSLRYPCKTDQDNGTCAKEKSACSNLRQRHIPGLRNKTDVNTDSEASVEDHVHVRGSEMCQVGERQLKNSTDVLGWFGALVSPNLRAAQTSFTEALEAVLELVAVQNKILATCGQIRQGGGVI